MKKVTALLLALVLAMSLCACSSSNTTSQSEESSQVEESSEEVSVEVTEEPDDSTIEFDDVLLAEDKNVEIYLTGFCLKYGDPAITFKTINKGEGYLDSISFPSYKAYIGDNTVECKYCFANDLAQGKISEDTLVFEKQNGEALDSIEDYYNLEGTFSYDLYEDGTGNWDGSWTLPFNIQKAINSDESSVETSTESKETVIYNIGDTVSTDTIEFTLTGFNFAKKINYKSYSDSEDETGLGNSTEGAHDGMIFANPECTIKNISKFQIDVCDQVEFTIDYNNGYTYNMYDDITYVHVENMRQGRRIIARGNSSGIVMDLSPLISQNYEYFIEVADSIEGDTESSLLLTVTLGSSNGSEDFVYKIR